METIQPNTAEKPEVTLVTKRVGVTENVDSAVCAPPFCPPKNPCSPQLCKPFKTIPGEVVARS